MDFNKLMLAKVLQEQDLSPLMERNVSVEMLPTADDQLMLNFILDFREKYGAVPSVGLFESEFPDAVLPQYVPDPLPFYVDRVVEQAVRNFAIRDVLTISKGLARAGDSPFETVGALRSKLTDLSRYEARGLEEDARDTALSTWDDYLLSKEHGGLIGIRTPWQTMDDQTQGWQEEMYVGIGARPKTGKTWFMLWVAYIAYLEGKKVLFFNKEVATKVMRRRLTAMRFKLDYKLFKEGLLTDADEKRVREGLEKWAKEKGSGWLKFYHSANTTTQVRAKVDELDPDLVVVDGAYLYTPSNGTKGAKGFEVQQAVSRDLKALAAETRKPTVISIQLNRGGDLKQRTSKNGVAPITMADIAGSDAFAQDVDVFYALEQTPDMKSCQQLKILPLALREDAGDPFLVHWGFNPVETKDLGPVTQVLEGDGFEDGGDEGDDVFFEG